MMSHHMTKNCLERLPSQVSLFTFWTLVDHSSFRVIPRIISYLTQNCLSCVSARTQLPYSRISVELPYYTRICYAVIRILPCPYLSRPDTIRIVLVMYGVFELCYTTVEQWVSEVCVQEYTTCRSLFDLKEFLSGYRTVVF